MLLRPVLSLAFVCAAAVAGPELRPIPSIGWVYFGTSTTGPGTGLFVAAFDEATGVLGNPRLAAEIPNPVFQAIAPNGRFLYSLGDRPGPDGTRLGAIHAFAINRDTGVLTPIGVRSTVGLEPAHINVEPGGRFLVTANYNGGFATVYPILPDGSAGPETGHVQHTGSGPNHDRQQAPHAHSVNYDPSGRFALVADLGLDQVRVYKLDAAHGLMAPNDPPFGQTPPGAGPRHLAFSPSGRFVYVADEISSSVTVFAWDGSRGTLTPLQTEPMLPPDYHGPLNTAAEIAVHPSGRWLYVSNRGDDSLVAFSIDSATGRISFLQRMGAGIKYPRNFAIDPSGHWIVCANRDLDNAIVLRIDPDTGRLSSTTQAVHVPQSICVRFLRP